MRNRQAEGLAEERSHRKPVGESSDKGGFGGCPNEEEPESGLRYQGRSEKRRRHRSEQRGRDQAISTQCSTLKILRGYRHAPIMGRPEGAWRSGGLYHQR